LYEALSRKKVKNELGELYKYNSEIWNWKYRSVCRTLVRNFFWDWHFKAWWLLYVLPTSKLKASSICLLSELGCFVRISEKLRLFLYTAFYNRTRIWWLCGTNWILVYNSVNIRI